MKVKVKEYIPGSNCHKLNDGNFECIIVSSNGLSICTIEKILLPSLILFIILFFIFSKNKSNKKLLIGTIIFLSFIGIYYLIRPAYYC